MRVRATSFGRSPKRRASREVARRPRGDESFVARFDARVSHLSALPPQTLNPHPLHLPPPRVPEKETQNRRHLHTHSPTNPRHPRRRRVIRDTRRRWLPNPTAIRFELFRVPRSSVPITSQQYTAVPMDDSIGSSKNPFVSSGPVGEGVRNSRPSLPPSQSTPSSMSPPCT